MQDHLQSTSLPLAIGFWDVWPHVKFSGMPMCENKVC
jgi:hypothetical protein